FFFQAEDGIRDRNVTGVQTCALPILTLDHLRREARARGADIVIFGHTHKPCLKFEKDMIIMNPGSLTYPRQENRLPSYIVLEMRSEERRVGKECRDGWPRDHWRRDRE